MEELKLRAPAKLNLHLEVVKKEVMDSMTYPHYLL